jgi:hypothetical protein
MTTTAKLSLLVIATMLFSCVRRDVSSVQPSDQRHFTVGHDDVGPFILQTARRFGNIPLATNGLPRISDQWSYFEDADGVVIMLSKQAFPVVLDFLRHSLGKPSGDGDSGRYYGYWLSTNQQWNTNDANLEIHQWGTNTEVDILWHQRPTF